MKSSIITISISILLISASTTNANLYTFNPVLDYGDATESSNICEKGVSQAWFGFDISTIPDSQTIISATFTTYLLCYADSSERSLWYEPDDSWISNNINQGNKALTEYIATVIDTGQYYKEVTFNLDLSKHNWSNDLIDNHVSLMVTGPLDGSHLCGNIQLLESGNISQLSIQTIPTPSAAVLCVIGLGFINRRIRKHKKFYKTV